jgi:HlyD family secretion protein
MLLAACASAAAPATRSDALVLAGSVRDDVVYVAVPGITAPTVDIKAGIDPSRLPPPPGLESEALASTATAAARAQRQQPAASPTRGVVDASTAKPRVAGRIAVMYVALGSHVKKGAPVAKLDDRLLVLGVRKAEADAAKARADIAVLRARIDDLYDKRDELYDARDKVLGALAKIADGEKKLAAGQALLDAGAAQLSQKQTQLDGGVTRLEAGIAALSKQIALIEKLPPDKQPPGLLAKLKAQRKALLVKLDSLLAARKKLSGAEAQAAAGQAKLDAGRAQLVAGKRAANAALRKIDEGIAEIDEGIDKLKRARTVAIAALPIKDRSVATAKDRLAQAIIVAPKAGQVIQTMQPGEVVMAGAPVVKLRPDGPSRVDTYLTIAQLPLTLPGVRVWVTSDSTQGKRFAASVASVLPEYTFPPSALPTTEVHLLRTVPVTLVLDAGARLPSGTPVDVSFETTGGASP